MPGSPDPQRCGGLGRGVGGCAGADEGRPAKKPRKAAAGQKEMLMPIEGKKPKEVPAKKPAARPSAEVRLGVSPKIRVVAARPLSSSIWSRDEKCHTRTPQDTGLS